MPWPSSPDYPALKWAHLPLAPVVWQSEKQFQGQDPASQSPAAQEILLLWPRPPRSPGGALTSCLQQTGTTGNLYVSR